MEWIEAETPDSTEDVTETAWQRATRLRFLDAYAEEDSIYDDLSQVAET